MSLDHLWAGWRSSYVESWPSAEASQVPEGCVLCRILGDQPGESAADGDGQVDPDRGDRERFVLRRGPTGAAVLNAYPYTNGHLMVLPRRHIGDLEDLSAVESQELWDTVTQAVRALKAAYRPDGINAGVNLGRAAGAGVPGHLHVHVLPRWVGDTNFTTTVANVRVLPESLASSWEKLRDAWPRTDA
jgi:ATP adenylyltransferase